MKGLPFVIASVCISAVAQVFFKMGVTRIGRISLAPKEVWGTLVSLAREPYIVLGLGLFWFSMLFWFAGIADMDLSKAYPMVGISYVITVLIARYYLGEAFTASRLAGIAVILVGVILINL